MESRRKKNGERAALKALLVLVLGAGAVLAAFTVGSLFFEHERIESEVSELAERALVGGHHGIEAQITKLVKSYGGVVDEGDIKLEVTEDKKKVTIEFPYRRIVNFAFTKRSYPFYIHVEHYSRVSGGGVEEGPKKGSGRYNEAFQNQ